MLIAVTFLGSLAWSFVFVALPFQVERLSTSGPAGTLAWTGWILGFASRGADGPEGGLRDGAGAPGARVRGHRHGALGDRAVHRAARARNRRLLLHAGLRHRRPGDERDDDAASTWRDPDR